MLYAKSKRNNKTKKITKKRTKKRTKGTKTSGGTGKMFRQTEADFLELKQILIHKYYTLPHNLLNYLIKRFVGQKAIYHQFVSFNLNIDKSKQYNYSYVVSLVDELVKEMSTAFEFFLVNAQELCHHNNNNMSPISMEPLIVGQTFKLSDGMCYSFNDIKSFNDHVSVSPITRQPWTGAERALFIFTRESYPGEFNHLSLIQN